MGSETEKSVPKNPDPTAGTVPLAKQIFIGMGVVLTWLVLAGGAIFLGLYLFTSSFLPPSHDDLATAYRKHPESYEHCATSLLAGTGTSKIPTALAGDGISAIVRKGSCVFFEARGIPLFSKGIVFCTSPDALQEITKQKPPFEEQFVELVPLSARWFEYTTN